jgi:hypothetical protein
MEEGPQDVRMCAILNWQRALVAFLALLALATTRGATHPEMQFWQAVSALSHGSRLQEIMQSKTFRQFSSAPQASRAVEQALAKLAIGMRGETRVQFVVQVVQ